MKRYFFNLIIMSLIASCSFQSAQLDYIKNFLTEEEDGKSPKKNWLIIWDELIVDLYAINVGDQVVFANEDMSIFFRNNQIYKVNGLSFIHKTIDIEKNNKILEYSLNNSRISVDICSDTEYLIEGNNEILIQSCIGGLNQKIYQNKLTRNSEGMLTHLKFKVLPEYSPIILRMK